LSPHLRGTALSASISGDAGRRGQRCCRTSRKKVGKHVQSSSHLARLPPRSHRPGAFRPGGRHPQPVVRRLVLVHAASREQFAPELDNIISISSRSTNLPTALGAPCSAVMQSRTATIPDQFRALIPRTYERSMSTPTRPGLGSALESSRKVRPMRRPSGSRPRDDGHSNGQAVLRSAWLPRRQPVPIHLAWRTQVSARAYGKKRRLIDDPRHCVDDRPPRSRPLASGCIASEIAPVGTAEVTSLPPPRRILCIERSRSGAKFAAVSLKRGHRRGKSPGTRGQPADYQQDAPA
jgi:hypothetical protein